MEAWRKPDPKDRNRGEESGSEAVDEARSIMIQPTRRPHPMPGLHQMFGSQRPDTQEFPSMAFMVHGGYSTVVLFDGEERKLSKASPCPVIPSRDRRDAGDATKHAWHAARRAFLQPSSCSLQVAAIRDPMERRRGETENGGRRRARFF